VLCSAHLCYNFCTEVVRDLPFLEHLVCSCDPRSSWSCMPPVVRELTVRFVLSLPTLLMALPITSDPFRLPICSKAVP
jgi:hypothetical protein